MDNFTLSNLLIVSFNAASISSLNKFNKFRNILISFSELPHIVIVQETWFSNVDLGIYKIPGYAAIHNCREDRYGGVSMYVQQNLKIYDVSLQTTSNCQFISICVKDPVASSGIKIVGYYRPLLQNIAHFCVY